ncbi:MAG: response regulator transcription factor [Pseudomonadota bacterium]
MPATVLIADDHAMTASGMDQLLRQGNDFEVVGVVTRGLEAIAQARRMRPDLLVVDYAMPDATGLEVVFEVSRWSPGTRTAIVTGTPTPGVLGAAAEAGVAWLFLKSDPLAEILAGLRAVVGGHTVRSPAVEAMISETRAADGLTMREQEVLAGIARGETNAGIAAQLGISPKTVDTHRTTLMRKLGVHSTAALLIRAVRDGLIDI